MKQPNLLEKANAQFCEIPQNLLIEVYLQLIKDLLKVGITHELSKDQALESNQAQLIKMEHLYDFTHNLVKSLFEGQSEKIWQLIYTVDIPEELFLEITSLSSEERNIMVTKIILLREWQKVECRKKYSSR
jgi:hypothetical protein